MAGTLAEMGEATRGEAGKFGREYRVYSGKN